MHIFIKSWLKFILQITITKHIITVDEYSTENAIEALNRLIRHGMIHPDDYISCDIDYDVTIGINWDAGTDSPEHYPVKFHPASKNGYHVWITSLTAGYGGTGPHGTLDALKLMGFHVTESEEHKILTQDDGPHVVLSITK